MLSYLKCELLKDRFLLKICLNLKLFRTQHFSLNQNIFGHKIFLDPTFFRPEVFDDPTFSMTQNLQRPKTFADPKFFGHTFF